MVDQAEDLEAVDEPTYSELVDYLENYADIVDGLETVSDLSDLARQVKTAAVRGLLLARDPQVLHPDSGDEFRHYLELLNGVTTEVEAIAGADPQPPVRKLALWAISLGTAADIEDALFPEQQLGGQGANGSRIRGRYLAILAQLRGLPGVSGSEGALAVTGPLGCFPEPLPDPFQAQLGPGPGRYGDHTARPYL